MKFQKIILDGSSRSIMSKNKIVTYLTVSIFLLISIKCKSNELNQPNKKTEKEIVLLDDKIKGYFNDDNLEDYILRDSKKSDKVTLTVYVNDGKNYSKKVSFEILNDDFDNVEDPLQNLFISNPKKGEILVGASCCGSFKTTRSCYYKFYKEIDSWILYKISTATVDSDFISIIDIAYQDFSYSIDGKKRDNKSMREKELKELKIQNQSQFTNLFEKYKVANDSKSIVGISGNLNFDDLAELISNIPLSKENINKYNDLAYYLSLCKDGNMSSIFILKKIIEKEPSRVVAYLNLADAQWNIEQYENAKESYKKYSSLMKSNGKDLNKIPLRVKERIK